MEWLCTLHHSSLNYTYSYIPALFTEFSKSWTCARTCRYKTYHWQEGGRSNLKQILMTNKWVRNMKSGRADREARPEKRWSRKLRKTKWKKKKILVHPVICLSSTRTADFGRAFSKWFQAFLVVIIILILFISPKLYVKFSVVGSFAASSVIICVTHVYTYYYIVIWHRREVRSEKHFNWLMHCSHSVMCTE